MSHCTAWFFLMFLNLSLVACDGRFTSRNQEPLPPASEKEPGHVVKPIPKTALRFQVRNDLGQPVANARILIGHKPGQPFAGNELTSDVRGEWVAPSEWTDAQPISITADGYIPATFFSQAPELRDFEIRRQPNAQQRSVRGETQGFGQLARDGFLDVGLVVPAVSRAQMVNFQISSLISPESDTIELVLGQKAAIPANLTLPRQRENYVVPITFDKPGYRLQIATDQPTQMVALHGRFPFRELVDELRAGKPIFDLINRLEIRGGGVQVIPAGTQDQNLNLSVSDKKFTKRIRVRAPMLASNQVMLALPLVIDGGMVYPTDVKRVGSRSTQEVAFSNGDPKDALLLTVARSADLRGGLKGPQLDEFSAVIRSLSEADEAPDFLSQVAPPRLNHLNLLLNAPQSSAQLAPFATYLQISTVEIVRAGDVEFEKKTTAWEGFVDDWATDLQLPEPVLTSSIAQQRRLEVYFLADRSRPPKSRIRVMGPTILANVSHVSKNAIDLQ